MRLRAARSSPPHATQQAQGYAQSPAALKHEPRMLQGGLQRHTDEAAALTPQPRSQGGIARTPRGLRDAPVDHVPARHLPRKCQDERRWLGLGYN